MYVSTTFCSAPHSRPLYRTNAAQRLPKRSQKEAKPSAMHSNLVCDNAFLGDLGSILLVKLGLDDTALFRGIGTADERSVAIEVLGNFLEGRVLGLDVEGPDKGEFDSEPDALRVMLGDVRVM